MGPKSYDWHLCKIKESDTEIHREEGLERDWNDAATSQGAPRIVGSHQKLSTVKEGFFPRALRGHLAHMDF